MTNDMKSLHPPKILPCLSHNEWEIRAAAARAIIGNKRAIRQDVRDTLARALAIDDNIYSLPEIIRAAGYTKAAQATNQLSKIMIHNKNRHIRYAAVEAQYWIRDPNAVPALIQTTQDPAENVALRSVYVLANINDPGALPKIREIAFHGKSDMQIQAVQALGMMRDTASGKKLLSLLDTQDQRLLHYTVWSLGQIAFNNAVPRLIPLLSHKSEKIRQTSYQALLAIADLRVLTYFIEKYRSQPDDPLALNAISAVYRKTKDDLPEQKDKFTTKELSVLASYLSNALPPEYRKVYPSTIITTNIKSIRVLKGAHFILTAFEHSNLEFLVLRNPAGSFTHARVIAASME
jgi:HEAT repeat protein